MTAQHGRFLLVGLIALGMAACSFFGSSEFEDELGPRLATLSGQSVFDRLVAVSDPAVVYVGAAGVHRIEPESGTGQALVSADRLPRSPLLNGQVVTTAAQAVPRPEGADRLVVLFDERAESFRRRVGGVYVVDTRRGGSLRQVLDGVSDVQVSPDGRRIAYVRAGPEPGQDSLFVAPFDEGRVVADRARRVAQGRPVVFAPDGSALVVNADPFGTVLRRVQLPDDLSQASVEPLPLAPSSTDLRLRLQGRWTDAEGLHVAFRGTGPTEPLRVWGADAETTRTVWTPPPNEQSSTNDVPRWASRSAPDGPRRLAVWTRRCFGSGSVPCARSRYTLWRVDPSTGAATAVARSGESVAEEAVFTSTGTRLALLVRRGSDTAVHLSVEK